VTAHSLLVMTVTWANPVVAQRRANATVLGSRAAAGARAFTDLLDAITQCQEADILPKGDPLEIAGPTWSLLHGISTLSIGHDLSHVGIRDDPQALAERSLTELLFR
jgi:hypothetical protein